MKRASILLLFVTTTVRATGTPPSVVNSHLAQGMVNYQERRWNPAMEQFIGVLENDPENVQAHLYLTMISKELQADQRDVVRAQRLAMLTDASRRLEDYRLDAEPIQNEIQHSAATEKTVADEKLHALCEQARFELKNNRLISANVYVFQALAQNASYAEAQQLLSDLQSGIRGLLDRDLNLTSINRYALEGFYAYGQADFTAAAAAWQKTRALATAEDSGLLHQCEPYEKIAQAHVHEDNRVAGVRKLFEDGVANYQKKRFADALDLFRKVAIADPDYPQLASFLVQAETALEKDRQKQLTEAMRRELARAFESGVKNMERSNYDAAQKNFLKVLKIEPSHAQARSYLAMAQAELSRRYDPKAAQHHYESGLIAYASGKLEDAMREWRLATKLDPNHQKAKIALGKAQKELTLYHDEQ